MEAAGPDAYRCAATTEVALYFRKTQYLIVVVLLAFVVFCIKVAQF